MAYGNKTHRNTHQLKDIARDMKLQHSVLSREIIEAALEVKRTLGELPFELEKRRA